MRDSGLSNTWPRENRRMSVRFCALEDELIETVATKWTLSVSAFEDFAPFPGISAIVGSMVLMIEAFVRQFSHPA